MQSAEDYIGRINAKLQLLLKQYESLQKDNGKLQSQLQQLKEKQDAINEKVGTLEQQNLILKASVSDMEDTEKKKLEAQINHYLKNIDNCIALLSQ